MGYPYGITAFVFLVRVHMKNCDDPLGVGGFMDVMLIKYFLTKFFLTNNPSRCAV